MLLTTPPDHVDDTAGLSLFFSQFLSHCLCKTSHDESHHHHTYKFLPFSYHSHQPQALSCLYIAKTLVIDPTMLYILHHIIIKTKTRTWGNKP